MLSRAWRIPFEASVASTDNLMGELCPKAAQTSEVQADTSSKDFGNLMGERMGQNLACRVHGKS
jgi:hypothetical protein